jgi:hypothetical protein
MALAHTEGPGPCVSKDCAGLMCDCENMTDQELLDKAAAGTFGLGTCYFHDQCPGCFCNYYVKVSYYPDPSGYDGGTGCLDTLSEVVNVLRDLCAEGICCCPAPSPYKIDCGLGPVWARDPVTGTCCYYEDSCEAPPTWEAFFTQEECELGDPTHP